MKPANTWKVQVQCLADPEKLCSGVVSSNKFHDTWGEAKYQLSTAGMDFGTPIETQKDLWSPKKSLDSSDISDC